MMSGAGADRNKRGAEMAAQDLQFGVTRRIKTLSQENTEAQGS
jgi:hypothetical protein